MCNLISGSNMDIYSQSKEWIPKNNLTVAFLFKFISPYLKIYDREHGKCVNHSF